MSIFKSDPDLTLRLEASGNSQSWLEWNKAKSFHPSVKLDYRDYQKLLKAFGELAMTLDRVNKENEIEVEEVPCTELKPVEDNDLITLSNDVEVFDRILESDQAFNELEESLGMRN